MTRWLPTTGCVVALALSLSVGCETHPRPRPAPVTNGASVGIGVADGGTGVIDPNSALCSPPVAGAMPFFPSSPFPPRVGPAVSQITAPPAISGGTLRVLKNDHLAVAADPDRDRVYIVDLARRALRFPAVELQRGDEPGRVIEDAAGRVHVALRGGGALVTISPVTGVILARRPVCAAPRGVVHDPATDLVHVACATGELVSLPAAGGDPVRVLKLGGDLRDVVIDAGKLRVSRFRSAQLLTIEADGRVSSQLTLPSFQSPRARQQQAFSPSVAWRTIGLPSGGVAMLHQRGLVDPIRPVGGGYYGSLESCDALLHAAVTVVAPGAAPKSGPALAGLVLAIDMAVSPDGKRLAIVAAGNATNAEADDGPPVLPQLFVTDVASATDEQVGCQHDGTHGPCMRPFGGVTLLPLIEDDPEADGGVAVQTAALSSDPAAAGPADAGAAAPLCDPSGPPVPDPALPQVVGQPISVAFDGDGQVIVQSREPAVLLLPDGVQIQLSTDSRQDTGHALFHANAGAFVACASCHAEGNDDGRVWNFPCDGARRTQSLQTGIAGTEPFHWDGREKDFSQLIQDVFMLRMSGPMMTPGQIDATLHWIDAQPRVGKSAPANPAAVERGRALFADQARAGCATCHAGRGFTNSQTVDVGTGGAFQVPSLLGLASHPPYLHDGCAVTLRDRFGACGGGDRHGVTSNLSSDELTDLVAFLETL
jgi:mono/diheme cytochrome c family protein